MRKAKRVFLTGISTAVFLLSIFSLLITTTSAGSGEAARAVSFTDISTGLPSDGGYNYVAFGDFNKDGEVDLAFGGENYGGGINTVGLYAYTGNGGSSWTDAGTGLPSENSWGGLQLADADGDGSMELYATDEHWGSSSNSGLKVFEYTGTEWDDSPLLVSTPVPAGNPNNVVIRDITGDTKLDMVVALKNGIQYFENTGGNPAVWLDRSSGLATGGEFTAISVADMNGDDLMDIVAADYNGEEYLYIQSGGGVLWSDQGGGIASSGITLGFTTGDVNGDGHMDIVLGTRDEGMKCWLGNSGGGAGGTAFEWDDGTGILPTGGRYGQIQLVDIEGDGDLDLVAPEGKSNRGIELYLGDGSTVPGTNFAWTKADNTGLTDTGNWYCANIFDINDDGSPDLATASWGSGIKAYLNSASGPAPGDKTPPSAVTDLAVTDVTEDSVTMTWTAPGDDGDSGQAAVYDLRYSEAEINVANWDQALPIEGEQPPSTSGSGESITITGLEQDTTYYFRLITGDEVPNWSQLSNQVSAKTLGVAKPALDVTITPEKTNIKPGEDIDITISVRSAEDSSAQSNAEVTITSENPDVGISPGSGMTDAMGVMSASITPPDVDQTTQVVIQIEVAKDGFKTSKNRITITVTPPDSANKANLHVTTSDITFSKSPISDGDMVTITAEISNIGKQAAGGFTVKFYVDGTQLGTDEDFTQLATDGSLKVDQVWKAAEGSHKIKVEVIPVDANLEHDDADNNAVVTINVAGESTEEDDDESDGIPMWMLLLIIIVIIIGAAAVIMSRRKKPMEAELADEPDRD